MPRPETHKSITQLEAVLPQQLEADTGRFRWRVRDCVFCSWRQLREQYSVDEMWQLLRQRRFIKAVRIAARDK
jgi:hypothetical protein